jgi:hypothetical protein
MTELHGPEKPTLFTGVGRKARKAPEATLND